jgi:uncharacterized membrane protein (UPF0127 family)
MLGVFCNLAIIWINSAHEVVDVQLAHRWRSILMPSNPARYVLEIMPERKEEFRIGDIIKFEEIISD